MLHIKTLIVIIAALCLLSCSKNTPEDVAYQFYQYLPDAPSKAYDYLSEEDKASITREDFIKGRPYQKSELQTFVNSLASHRVDSVTQNGNTATAHMVLKNIDQDFFYEFIGENDTGKDIVKKLRELGTNNIPLETYTRTVKLIKENGQWRVYKNYKKLYKEIEKLKNAD